ncbi:TolC family protein [Noviherbaspirillum sp. CPCC 100848]|uniref:TolC family protein n=1 Tax=Noviherbaspirillum album TaxID=3080276 RepID=A0ABU6JA58_9BURK|nr:TolC family protein [Noviherbaspirillum sp. CPCC 100848]MEC4720532.1 TolC family protein [Noviherbaspirillum sp. CPCC 100848]
MTAFLPRLHSTRPVFPVRIAIAAAALLLTACGSVPVRPLTQDDLARQTAADRMAAQEGVEPLSGELSMDEAVARALKYNLDRRTRMMEEALALNQLDASSWDMLPRLTASAGYSSRNKNLITRSEDSVTGLPSLANPYISSERSHAVYDLGLTWNLLDFGMSYVFAKQQGDRVMIATERRRKAMHTLIQDVRTAFWRTASAQKLRDDVKQAIALAEGALQDARKAETERVRSPIDALRYQRQLLENLRLLESIEQELSSGRIELASLMNIPLHQEFRVQEPNDNVDASLLEVPVQRMEEVAVTQNGDIREQFYTSRIAVEETKRTMLRMFPNLSFNYNIKYDTDRFLINNQWNDTGLQLSYNLLNLLSAPTQKKLADAGVKLADQRRIAAQMTVLTQLHLSRLAYQIAYRQYVRADQVWQADAKIAEHIRNRETAETQSKLEQVANSTTAILSLLRRYQSLSQVQAAGSKLQATMGLEPVIGSVTDMSLQELTRTVGQSMREWSKQLDAPQPVQPLPAKPLKTGAARERTMEQDVEGLALNLSHELAPATLAGIAPSPQVLALLSGEQ